VNFHYNVTGRDRKKLATAVGENLRQPAVYVGVPTYGYKIGDYTIDRHCTLICPADARVNDIVALTNALKALGYTANDSDYEQLAVANESDDNNSLIIEIPRTCITDEYVTNLEKIVTSKKSLIKKAIGADNLKIVITNHSLQFPWFTLTGADGEADAYGKFVSAMCEMAKRQKRVSAKEKESTNNKFDMRVFLIRLGFIGDEHKQARKILLRNLTGNSSFKNENSKTEEP
jgi:hypothetical protein